METMETMEGKLVIAARIGYVDHNCNDREKFISVYSIRCFYADAENFIRKFASNNPEMVSVCVCKFVFDTEYMGALKHYSPAPVSIKKTA